MASSSFFLLLLLLLLLLLRLLLFVRGFVSHHYKALRQKPINTSSSSSSSSSSGLRWKYDVFINFRGEDTRRGFVSHLYRALRQKPLNTFIDTEELRKGDRLSELLTAIRESRLSIVVFSQNYASSTWCLKELVEILECNDNKNQIVVPIFYEVDPSDIRKLKGSFAEAFDRHEGHSNANMEEVRSWRSALTRATNLSGWDSRNYEDDAKLIEEIVEDVYRKLIHISSTSSKAKGLIEMDSHMHEMHLLLHPPGVETNDVRVVGIWGMGGLGKTTIARAVRDEIASQFEACCFLENVKEGFMKHGQLHMQTQLLSSISNNKVGSSNILDKGFQKLEKLKFIDLSECLYLKETPDFTEMPNLERLILRYCIRLVEVHPSISSLTNLGLLNLHGCIELKILPSIMRMKSLKTLVLSNCQSLEMFPEISEVMEELSWLSLSRSKIKELPSSINNLTGLSCLVLDNCKELKSLPNNICQLKSLEYLYLSDCTKFDVFPSIEENMVGLRELHLDGTSIERHFF